MINRDLQLFELQKNEPIKKLSGASDSNWVKVSDCMVAIHQSTEYLTIDGVTRKVTSFQGLTKDKSIQAKQRLKKGELIYSIRSVNSDNRFSILDLELWQK